MQIYFKPTIIVEKETLHLIYYSSEILEYLDKFLLM